MYFSGHQGTSSAKATTKKTNKRTIAVQKPHRNTGNIWQVSYTPFKCNCACMWRIYSSTVILLLSDLRSLTQEVCLGCANQAPVAKTVQRATVVKTALDLYWNIRWHDIRRDILIMYYIPTMQGLTLSKDRWSTNLLGRIPVIEGP